ncbi:MAG: hypothetical protein ACREM2_12150, partial [Vulcanimicrobiaceae bacterium]
AGRLATVGRRNLERTKPATPSATMVTPLDATSARATNFEVRFDGGAFDLHVYEMRESSEDRSGFLVNAWQFIEIGRFSLSPIALARLKQSLVAATTAYSKAMGHDLPEQSKLTAALKKIAEESAPKTP